MYSSRKFNLILILFCFFITFEKLLAAIPTNGNIKTTDPLVKIKDMSCDQLIATAKNPTFTLNNLAGLRAHKNCPEFKFNLNSLSIFEKRLYTSEIEQAFKGEPDLIQNKPQPSIQDQQELQIKTLHIAIKKEKNQIEKLSLIKKLRTLYKSLNRKGDVISTSNDLYTLAFKQFKLKKKDPKLQDLYLESGLFLARQLWTNDNPSKAQDILKVVIKYLKSKINIYEAYLVLGKIHDEQSQFDIAINYYDLTLEELKTNPPKNVTVIKDRVQWTKAWILYKTQKWLNAENAFALYGETTPEISDQIKSRFFQARCLEKLNKIDEAKKIYQKISQDDFYSYYSLLSYRFLNQNIPAFSKLKPPQKFIFNTDLTFLAPQNKQIFFDLIKHEELDLAEKIIPLMTENLEDNTNAALILANQGNRFLPLFAAYAKLTTEQKLDIIIKYPQLIFPKRYESSIEEMAMKTKLPTSLIYSIIRQESAFNPEAKSHANAFGLMQIIPDLAKKLSKKFKLNYQNIEDLLIPEKNIIYGSYELAEQVSQYNENYTFVAAAYNAGPNALKKWIKTKKRPHFDIIDFIEEIPYDETRLYVKVVARNHLFYERLSSPDKETRFPENYVKSISF